MSEALNSTGELSRLHYISRINKALDFIEQNLDTPLYLEKVAEIASFSPFHFHRIFTSLTGETLNSFIRRKRLERAAGLLLSGPIAVNDISVRCGFNSNASFSRAFKEFFGLSASSFRSGGYAEYIKKVGGEVKLSGEYFTKMNPLAADLIEKRRKFTQKVEIRHFDSFPVAYCRHVGRFQDISIAYQKLFQWAGPRDLTNKPGVKVLTLYHDDPNFTSMENLYQSACISIGEDVKTSGEIGKTTIEGGLYACGHFRINAADFTEAWAGMYAGWLPVSGYECDNRLPFELYYKTGENDPKGLFIFDICIPIKVLDTH